MYNEKPCSNTNWKANSEGIKNISRGAACICCFNNKAQIMFAHTAWNGKVPYILFIIDGLLYCSRQCTLHSLIIVVFLHLFDVIMLSQSVKRKHTACHTVCTLLHVILHHVTWRHTSDSHDKSRFLSKLRHPVCQLSVCAHMKCVCEPSTSLYIHGG